MNHSFSNHPINWIGAAGKSVGDWMGSLTNLFTSQKQDSPFIRHIEQYIKELRATESPQLATVEELFKIYNSILSFELSDAYSQRSRELYLAAYEEILTHETGGFFCGSCLSGKDRKALLAIFTAAIRIYKAIYNEWFQFRETNVEKINAFNQIVKAIFESRHFQVLAGQNAPGAEALKTVFTYLPQGIVDLLSKLDEEDRIATNNDVKHIPSKINKITSVLGEIAWPTSNIDNYIIEVMQWCDQLLPHKKLAINERIKPQLLTVAQQIGDQLCTDLYTALRNLLHQRDLWIKRTSSPTRHFKNNQSSLPYGINQAVAFMEKDSPHNVINRMAILLGIFFDRQGISLTRHQNTQELYNEIESLCYCVDANAVQVKARELIDTWQERFEKSKEHNVRAPTP